MTSGAALIHGDALRLPLRDESVDLVISSPPYWALRSYQDDGEHYDGQLGSEPDALGFLANLWAVMDECWRVLKPTGSCWMNLGDKYAGGGMGGGPSQLKSPGRIDALHAQAKTNTQTTDVPPKSLMGLPWRFALGLINPTIYRTDRETNGPQWILRAEVIWNKPNGLPESVTDRVRRSHEQWFHLTKQGRYYAAVDEVREKHATPTFTARQDGTDHHARATFAAEGHHRYDVRTNNPLGKLPGSVWTVPSEPLAVPPELGVDHFAAFPTEWPRRIVLGWSPSGICVKCGDGRVPVVNKTFNKRTDTGTGLRNDLRRDDGTGYRADLTGMPTGSTEATITGYSCRCDVPIAPTRPAVVLDPFAGTGTVPLVARTLGRYGIGVDLSRDYLRLAHWRVYRSGHGRKAEGRTNRERQGALW